MDIESYIKDLAPELQEKARACGSVEELLALAKEAAIPVPDEVLAAIAGREGGESVSCKKPTCPKCGSTYVFREGIAESSHWVCNKCHYMWR